MRKPQVHSIADPHGSMRLINAPNHVQVGMPLSVMMERNASHGQAV